MPGGIHPPIEEILRWPTPNYVNPVTRPNTVLYVACIGSFITFTMLMARCWVRFFHQRNPGWDDCLVLAGTIPTIGATALFPLAIRAGFDRHIWDVDFLRNPGQVVLARKYVLAILCIFCAASGLIKISILLFYRRLSARVVSNRFRWATWITIGFIATSTIAFTIAPIAGCQPMSAFWDQLDPLKTLSGYKYRCFDEGADIFIGSVISTVQDLITAMLPTFLYWNLRIPLRQKVALFGIFATGYGVAALGALRAYCSWHIYYETYDATWATWDLFLVTLLELQVGCFCANAPTLKVFFKHFFHEKLTSSAKQSAASRQKGQLSGTQSSKSSASMFKEKFSSFFSKSSSNHSRDGYLSEPHTNVSVDIHGGVQVRREVHIGHSPAHPGGVESSRRDLRESADTTEMIYAQYYDDIEMGNFTTGRDTQASSPHFDNADGAIKALPAIPQVPKAARTKKSLVPFSRQPTSPKEPTEPEWPLWTQSATIAEERHDDAPRPDVQSDGKRKPQWQTWT